MVPACNVPVPRSSPPRVDVESETMAKPSGDNNVNGPAVALSDADLVNMLRRPPKAVPQLRTKSGYIDYFRGMPCVRMKSLLYKAYDDLEPEEREAKVVKRMALISDILV